VWTKDFVKGLLDLSEPLKLLSAEVPDFAKILTPVQSLFKTAQIAMKSANSQVSNSNPINERQNTKKLSDRSKLPYFTLYDWLTQARQCHVPFHRCLSWPLGCYAHWESHRLPGPTDPRAGAQDSSFSQWILYKNTTEIERYRKKPSPLSEQQTA
jgi:hypothetical protein